MKAAQTPFPAPVEARLQQGLRAHQQGRWAEAEAIYQEILTLQPRHFDAMHLLGLVALQTNRAARGAELIAKAIGFNKKVAAAHSNLAYALNQLGRHKEAVMACGKAIALKPDYAEAYNNRAIALTRLGRLGEALTSCDKAIALKPDYAEAHNNRAMVLMQLGRPEEALAGADKAVALKPDYAEAHNSRAMALNALQRAEEALASCERAIALRPDYAEAHNNRGIALAQSDRPDAAVASYDRAIALNPDYAEAHNNRAGALNALRRHEEALASCERAIALRPDYAEAHNNRGITLNQLERPEEASAAYDRAIALRPDYAEAHQNQSQSLLLTGRYERGLREYEYRHKRAGRIEERPYAQPLWLGEQDIAGKTLLIHPELYLGDMIQFCRYARCAEARGARVILAAQEPLRRLLRGLSPTVEIIGQKETPPPFDYHIPVMSLPLAFGTTIDTIPADVPYLAAEPDRVAQWRARLGDHGLKIGICWQGSTLAYAAPLHRSFPLAEFRPIAQLPGVRLISLQKSDGLDQLAALPPDMKVETLGPDFDAGPDAFIDTAAVMAHLDLVITADTAIAHVAGALARPTWMVLREVPDWRWHLGRSDSPWYPTMRLFRQQRRADWRSAFAALEQALAAAIAAGTLPAPRA